MFWPLPGLRVGSGRVQRGDHPSLEKGKSLSVSRGVNRFQGLAQVLKNIHENYTEVEGLEGYLRWAESAQELSDKSLEEAFEKTENICMKKALDWSRLVNQSMAMVSDTKKPPFEGTEDALRLAREQAGYRDSYCSEPAGDQ